MNKLKTLFSPKPPPTGFNVVQPRLITKPESPRPSLSENPPRLLIIGAGSRGTALARAIVHASNGLLVAVADPDPGRRRSLGRHYIWGMEEPEEDQEFAGWREFLEWELERRKRLEGDGSSDDESGKSSAGIDGIVICTADHTHREIVVALAPLGLHMMCEKPLATTWEDCLEISRSLGCNLGEKEEKEGSNPSALFAIGHVMRYRPNYRALRAALCEDKVIGDIVSVEHTENVGWWHFAHSYVRGNWRNEATSGPTLLTKSCHDIDFLMWILCSGDRQNPPHLPSSVSAFGSLTHFRQARKPVAAGAATNCTACPAEKDCMYSARKIYYDKGLLQGLGGWPVDVVVPDIEDLLDQGGLKGAREGLEKRLEEDYTTETPKEVVDGKQWYGRCVFEADNNVCDDQTVHISWDDDPMSSGGLAKSATFHMTAFSEEVCEKRTKIYGTQGEIEVGRHVLNVRHFKSGTTEDIRVPLGAGGHGGGDHGLMKQFVFAIDEVKNQRMTVAEAQNLFIGCTVEEILLSHAMVFAAEEARKSKNTVDWGEWWENNLAVATSGQDS